MTISSHAQARMQQRGMPAELLDIIMRCGRVERAPGGADKIFLGRHEARELRCRLKQLLQLLDRAEGSSLIVKDGCILTVYKHGCT